MTAAQRTSEPPSRPRAILRHPTRLRAVGLLIAALALALCVRTLVDSWHDVHTSLADASVGWLAAAFVGSAASMAALAHAWWRCLRLFGAQVPPGATLAWYFAGEFGKYLPGGVWSVLGRGELAARDGRVRRSTSYGTTLLSYAAMCLAAAAACGVLGPIAAADGSAPRWWWCFAALLPASVGALHPRVLAALLDTARRITGGRVDLEAPQLSRTVRLIAWSVPAWVALGAASVAVAHALNVDQSVLRVGFAAIAAWVVGFLAVPVPAGAGVRELVFVGLCGLPAAQAVVVAVIARLLLVLVDTVGGLGGLGSVVLTARKRRRPRFQS